MLLCVGVLLAAGTAHGQPTVDGTCGDAAYADLSSYSFTPDDLGFGNGNNVKGIKYATNTAGDKLFVCMPTDLVNDDNLVLWMDFDGYGGNEVGDAVGENGAQGVFGSSDFRGDDGDSGLNLDFEVDYAFAFNEGNTDGGSEDFFMDGARYQTDFNDGTPIFTSAFFDNGNGVSSSQDGTSSQVPNNSISNFVSSANSMELAYVDGATEDAGSGNGVELSIDLNNALPGVSTVGASNKVRFFALITNAAGFASNEFHPNRGYSDPNGQAGGNLGSNGDTNNLTVNSQDRDFFTDRFPAGQVYVRTSGSDSGCNGTENTDDGTGTNLDGSECAFGSIQKSVNEVASNGTVDVASGNYTENVDVTKSVTLNGNNAGTAGNGSRSTETVVDAGTSTPVSQTTDIAFTVQDDDVTIDGFKLTGNQGIVLDPSTVSNSPTNDGSGLTVQNNLVATDIVGVRIENVTTTGSKSFTVADNQFEITRQSYDLVDTQEQNLGGDADNTEGDENFEYTSSVGIRTIDGDQTPTIQNNVVTTDGNDASGDGDNDGSFYGYAIDGLKVTSGRTTIAGDPGNTGNTGTIQGTAQGISILDGQSTRQSNVAVEDFSISAMSGSAPNNSAVNFQAGVFTYTATGNNDNITDVRIANATVEGLDFSDPNGNSGANASANIYLSNFDFGSGTPTHNVTIEGVTIQNTEHRGISLAGTASGDSEGADDINATITDDGAGDNTIIKGVAAGNDAHPIHSENGGSPTINNTTLTNVNTSAAQAIHVRPSEDAGTVTIGTDVRINSEGQVTFGDQGADIDNPAGNQIDVTDVSTDLTVDGFRQDLSTGNVTLNVKSGTDFTLEGVNNNTQLPDLDDSQITLNAPPILGSGTHEAASTVTLADIETQNTGTDPSLTGAGTLRITGLLTLRSGTFDVTSGTFTLASTSETSTASIAGSGSGSVNGDVTFERTLDKSDDAAHFRFLAAPTTTTVDGSGSAGLLSNTWTQATGTGADQQVGSGSDATVYTYNESATLGGDPLKAAWTDVSNLDATDNVTPGKGFLTYLFANHDADPTVEGFPLTLTVTGSVQAEENNGSAVDLSGQITYNGNDSQSEDGWNLIANPFMAPVDWESIENDGTGRNNVNATVYVYDPADGTYDNYVADGSGTSGTNNGQGRYIAPFQAFFVQANGSSPDIGGIDDGDKATGRSPAFKRAPSDEAPPTLQVRLQSKDGDWKETTAFRFTDGASPGTDDYDAYQLEPLTDSYALVASEMDGTDALFDHQNRPVPTHEDTIDLALDLTRNGAYTLAVGTLDALPDDWSVILENADSGARYDLQDGGAATFAYAGATSTAAKTTADPRGRLEALQKNGPTVVTASSATASAEDAPSFRLYVGPEAELPVELARFDGRVNEDDVELSWATVSEMNNAGFRVQRRAGGARASSGRASPGSGQWTALGFVAGEGTTTETQRYRFADTELPYEGKTFTYRLKQIDTDGSAQYSDPIEVERRAPSSVRLRSVFPNPVRTRATVRYELPEERDVTLALYDVLGRRVETVVDASQEAGRKQIELPISSLSAGVHFVRLRVRQTVQTRKLVVVE